MESLNQLLALPTYRMVVVNSILFVTLAIGIAIYTKIWPKKKIDYAWLTLLISLLPIISIFRQGTYESGDLSLHATRLTAFWEAISQGEIIPRWAGSLNAGFGYPLFQFIYPLPYYLASFWHWIGFGFINSIKITIALAYIFSGLVFFRLAKKHVSDLAAFTGAVLYLFAPYHLVDLHFRVAFGEIVGSMFLPLTMLCGNNYIDSGVHRSDGVRKTRLWLVLSGISFAGLILSHQAIALISPIIFMPYLWLVSKNKPPVKRLLTIITPLLAGLVLSAFYWLPVLVEGRYTLMNQFASGVQFQNIREYLYSPWRLGFLFQGPKGELSFLIGYVHIALVIAAVWKLIKGELGMQKRLAILLIGLLLVNCYLLLPSSKIVWGLIPFLNNLQFSYRLLVPIALLTSTVGALYVNQIKRPAIVYVIIFITVSTTLLNWGNRRTIPQIDDNYLKTDLPYATVRGEGLDPAGTKWSDVKSIWQKEPAQNLLQLDEQITNSEVITNLNRQKQLIITTSQPVLVKVNQLYFPGWTVTVNGEIKPILFEQKEHYGMIAFHVPEGESEIEIEFRDTLVRRIAGIISLIGTGIIGLLLVRPVKRRSSFGGRFD